MQLESVKRKKLAPVKLKEKLKKIRIYFDLTQGEMLMNVNPNATDDVNRARISQYEKGTRIPSLIEVLNYARFAGIDPENLLNDELDLPSNLYCFTEIHTHDQTGKENHINTTNENARQSLNLEDKDSLPNDQGPSPVISKENTHKTNDSKADEPINITEREKANTKMPPPILPYSLNVSENVFKDCKTVYLRLINEIPFGRIKEIPPDKFIEQLIYAAIADFETRGAGSELARQIQHLFNGKESEKS